jgi:modulator of FtsH protease
MNPNIDILHGPAVTVDADRQRVLRNTYGCWPFRCCPPCWAPGSACRPASHQPDVADGIGLIVFLAGAFGFMFAIEKYKNSGLGVALLLGFTFFMGLMLSRLLGWCWPGQRRAAGDDGLRRYQRGVLRHGHAVQRHQARPVGHGKFLFIGAILVLVAGIANVFIQSSA